jgi:hypothetical protein
MQIGNYGRNLLEKVKECKDFQDPPAARGGEDPERLVRDAVEGVERGDGEGVAFGTVRRHSSTSASCDQFLDLPFEWVV